MSSAGGSGADAAGFSGRSRSSESSSEGNSSTYPPVNPSQLKRGGTSRNALDTSRLWTALVCVVVVLWEELLLEQLGF